MLAIGVTFLCFCGRPLREVRIEVAGADMAARATGSTRDGASWWKNPSKGGWLHADRGAGPVGIALRPVPFDPLGERPGRARPRRPASRHGAGRALPGLLVPPQRILPPKGVHSRAGRGPDPGL